MDIVLAINQIVQDKTWTTIALKLSRRIQISDTTEDGFFASVSFFYSTKVLEENGKTVLENLLAIRSL